MNHNFISSHISWLFTVGIISYSVNRYCNIFNIHFSMYGILYTSLSGKIKKKIQFLSMVYSMKTIGVYVKTRFSVSFIRFYSYISCGLLCGSSFWRHAAVLCFNCPSLFKGTVSRKITGIKVVSIDSSFFKLLPQKISQIFIPPPSCFLHKTIQRHIIECCELFLKKIPIRQKYF